MRVSATMAESRIQNSKEMITITLSAWVAIGLRFIGLVTGRRLGQSLKEKAMTMVRKMMTIDESVIKQGKIHKKVD
jgi:hypothetical protein